MKRYPKRSLSRHRAQGRRTRWRKKRIELRLEWDPRLPRHGTGGIQILTGVELDTLAENIIGATRMPGETDFDFRTRLNELYRGAYGTSA